MLCNRLKICESMHTGLMDFAVINNLECAKNSANLFFLFKWYALAKKQTENVWKKQ